jgi:hypothetical protein
VVLGVVSAVGMIVVGLVAGAGISSAHHISGSFSKSTTYTCTFPDAGPQQVPVDVTGSYGYSRGGLSGQYRLFINVNEQITIPAGLVTGPDVARLEVLTDPEISVTHDGAPVPARYEEGLGDAELMYWTGLSIDPQEPGLYIGSAPGTATFTIVPRDANGRITAPRVLRVPCTLNPGQDARYFSFDYDLTGPHASSTTTTTTTPTTTSSTTTTTTTPPAPQKYGFSVGGSATLPKLGSVPLSGSLDATQQPGAAGFDGALTLNATTARLTAYGFLPVTARVVPVPVGQTVGTYSGTGLATRSLVTINLPKVTLLGLPISQSPDCRTSQPATIDLSAAQFDVRTGGTLTGTFAISPFAGCGTFTDWINQVAAGDGNGAAVTLTRK